MKTPKAIVKLQAVMADSLNGKQVLLRAIEGTIKSDMYLYVGLFDSPITRQVDFSLFVNGNEVREVSSGLFTANVDTDFKFQPDDQFYFEEKIDENDTEITYMALSRVSHLNPPVRTESVWLYTLGADCFVAVCECDIDIFEKTHNKQGIKRVRRLQQNYGELIDRGVKIL